MAPQSFTFVEEIETFEKKKEEKNLHLSSQHEDSSRSSICEMIQNFSDRLDRNEIKNKKNSFSTEFLIHHGGSKRYFDDIEEEETLSSEDSGNFIYAKEETERVEDTVDISYGANHCKPPGSSEREEEMLNVKIHLAEDSYGNRGGNGSALLSRENESSFEEERTFQSDQSRRQDSSLTLSSDYQHSDLHDVEISLEEDYYKHPSPSAAAYQRDETAYSEREFRNQRQYKEQEYQHHHQYQSGPQYVNFTFPRPSVKKHCSFHKNVPKVVRFNEM